MEIESRGGYNPDYDALPEPEGGYTKEYIEQAIEKWEKEIAGFEVKKNDLMSTIEKGKFPEVKESLEEEIEVLDRQIKMKQVLIEMGRKKIEELFPEEEIKL